MKNQMKKLIESEKNSEEISKEISESFIDTGSRKVDKLANKLVDEVAKYVQNEGMDKRDADIIVESLIENIDYEIDEKLRDLGI